MGKAKTLGELREAQELQKRRRREGLRGGHWDRRRLRLKLVDVCGRFAVIGGSPRLPQANGAHALSTVAVGMPG